MTGFDNIIEINGKKRGVKIKNLGGNGGYQVSVCVDDQTYYQLPFVTFSWTPEVKDHPDRYIRDSEEEASWSAKTGHFTRGGRDLTITDEDVDAAKKALAASGILNSAADEHQHDYTAPTEEEYKEMTHAEPFDGVQGSIGVVGSTPPSWYAGQATCLSCGGEYTYQQVKNRGGEWNGTVCECGC